MIRAEITRSLNFDNKATAQVKKDVATNPDTAQLKRYTTSFNQDPVFEFGATFTGTREYCSMSAEQQEVFWRRKLAFELGADGHMCAHDQTCMRTTQEGMRLFNQHGKELTMDKLRDGHCLAISLWNTNRHEGRWSPTFRISAVPPAVVQHAAGKSPFISTYEYGSRARHRKARMWG